MSPTAVRGSIKLSRRFVTSFCLLSGLLVGCALRQPLGLPVAGEASPWAPLQAEGPVPELDPQHAYLRVTQGQQVGWLVYGGMLAWHGTQVETWYGADGGVLRLLHGRLVGFASPTLQWSETQRSLPDQPQRLWGAASHHHFERWVDRMPGWLLNQHQARHLQAMGAKPPQAHRLLAAAPSVVWWRETAAAAPETTPATAQDSWYALDTTVQPPLVIYGQQCLQGSQPRLCLSWQRWPAIRSAAVPVPVPMPEPVPGQP